MKTRTSLFLIIALLGMGMSTGSMAQTDASYQSDQQGAQAQFSQAQLDSILAPIALYPDTLLSHLLIAATYPLEVVQANRWVKRHPSLSGEDAVNAVENEDWDPSVQALVAFPDLLARMSDDLDWTQQLGDAFLADEGAVMDSIQNLRNKAYAAGSLDRMEHVKVVREDRIITIEPSIERVVYVPVYDTQVVYGNWWWPSYPPIYWHSPHSAVFVAGFYWGPRIFLGNNFYYSGCHWRNRRVIVVDRHSHYRPTHFTNRAIVSYQKSQPWSHNPVHRRGVAYYDRSTSTRYHSSRESYQSARIYRDQKHSGLNQNNHQNHDQQKRDQQRHDEQRQSRYSDNKGARDTNSNSKHYQAESRHTGAQNNSGINTQSTRPAAVAEPRHLRAEELRTRLGNTQTRTDANTRSNTRDSANSNSTRTDSPRIYNTTKTTQGSHIQTPSTTTARTQQEQRAVKTDERMQRTQRAENRTTERPTRETRNTERETKNTQSNSRYNSAQTYTRQTQNTRQETRGRDQSTRTDRSASHNQQRYARD